MKFSRTIIHFRDIERSSLSQRLVSQLFIFISELSLKLTILLADLNQYEHF